MNFVFSKIYDINEYDCYSGRKIKILARTQRFFLEISDHFENLEKESSAEEEEAAEELEEEELMVEEYLEESTDD